jgi:hypothetical protein
VLVVNVRLCCRGFRRAQRRLIRQGRVLNPVLALAQAGCLGLKSCVHKCEHKLVDPCIQKLVNECDDKCRKTIIDPCETACNKNGLAICEKAVGMGGSKACSAICVEAATAAVAAGGGPEEPVGDAVAAAIEAGCEVSCEEAVDKKLVPGTKEFEDYVCHKIGF